MDLKIPIMPFLKVPRNITTSVEAHRQWLDILKTAQELVIKDLDLQVKVIHLKERFLPPEVLGRNYALYCNLINKMYDAYLNSVHMQRSPYILEIISVFVKRMYELRNELVHIIINDYIYVDAALAQLRMTPFDIQIVVPYHIPLESRPDSLEQMIQKMWSEAVKRKNAPPPPPVKAPEIRLGDEDSDFGFNQEVEEVEEEPSVQDVSAEASIHTIIPEEFIQACVIQKQERFRQFFMKDYRTKCNRRRMYFAENVVEAPMNVKILAATLIQNLYRQFMRIKRQRLLDQKRDVLLGLVPDPCKPKLDFDEENCMMYEMRRQTRLKIKEGYLRELEREKTRLIVYKKDNQIEDITEQIWEWFNEWYKGYGFFPEFPFDVEGGTMLVIRGDYPSVEEKKEEDEKLLAATKGKTKEQLRAEKEQAAADAELKAEVEREQKKKEAEQLFKMKCNPYADPGYQPQRSEFIDDITNALNKYRAAWSIFDRFPPETSAETIYGYMKPLMTEELMCKLHQDCRIYVDELMRLDLKLLIKMQQLMYKNVGWKFPKQKPRRAPKPLPIPKTLNVDSQLLKSLEDIFDLGIISKPTSKVKDIYGDLNFAAYDLNLRDPDAKFPPPSYGDVRRRLLLSCVFGSGIEPGAKRKKSVMLLGPPRNGKSFLVDCVAGEMNAVKIDISPEVFSAVVKVPGKMLTLVFLAARVFQPAVIFLKDIERVFAKKVTPENNKLKVKKIIKPLTKLLKSILADDKIIFIATCSYPLTAKARPMVTMFNELILVPRADYGSLQLFLYDRFQRIKSMPRDYCVQALAQILQGYGYGDIIRLFNDVMTAQRIVRLNVDPLSPAEFLEPLIEMELEPLTIEDYQEYVNFYLKNSPLKTEREEFEIINVYRDVAYKMLAKKKPEQ